MSRVFLLMALFSLLCGGLFAADHKPLVVVGYLGSKIPIAFQPEEGLHKAHAHWIGLEAEKMLIVQLPESEKWRDGRFSFTPKATGRVRIELKATAVTQTGQRVPAAYYYDDIQVNGQPIPNGGFEEGARGYGYYRPPKAPKHPGRVIYDPYEAASGNNCVGAWDWGPVAFAFEGQADQEYTITFKYRKAGVLPPDDQQNDFFPLSLKSVANMGYADPVAGDGVGGWTDQGPDKDLRAFRPGRYRSQGIPFVAEEPSENDGKACVVLKSPHSTFGKDFFTVEVNRHCNRLALITGAAWAPDGLHAADVLVRYTDGKLVTIPLITGKNICEWGKVQNSLSEAELVWSGTNPGGAVGLYACVLKLPYAGQVRHVTVRRVPGCEVVTCVVAMTAAMIRNEMRRPEELVEHRITLAGSSEFVALPVEMLLQEMREAALPAAAFFEERNLPRLRVQDSSGRDLPLAVAKFQRKLSPVLLVRRPAGEKELLLKLGEKRDGIVMEPAAALQAIRGEVPVAVNDAPWAKGLLFRAKDFTIKNGRVVRDQDSFYRQTVDFEPEDTELTLEFTLPTPQTVKLFTNVRHTHSKSQSNRARISIDGKPFVVVGGVYYKSYAYYWSGGQRVELSAGRHTLRLWMPGKKEWRTGLQLAGLYLGYDVHAPENAGFADEMAALRQAGFVIHGDSNTALTLKDIPVQDRLYRTMNPQRSWPDLSAMVNNQIDQRGALRTHGATMVFADGTPLPYFWGRNMDRTSFERLWRTDRLGDANGDGVERLMKRYKELGISTLRFFYFTMPMADWTNINHLHMGLLDAAKMTYRPGYIESYQRLIAAAHKHGIYLKITMGAFPWELRYVSQEMQAMFYHPEMIARRKKMTELLFAQPNPYRNGIRPIDDPTVAIIEIENECNFLGGGFGRRAHWKDMAPADKAVLYPIWRGWLKERYGTYAALQERWGVVPLVEPDGAKDFSNVEFPPSGDAALWGNDDSRFEVKMDDLRVSSATFGKSTRSNPVASDGFEFMYHIYTKYLTQMSEHLRQLGFKGVITTCGPDTENYYYQRAAANEVVDAISGGTSYWNCNGYGFVKSLAWLAPMVYASHPEKPVISREYGANLAGDKTWWGNVISAAVQKAMGKAYLYDFASAVPGPDVSQDYLYPEDAHEQRSIDLLHDLNFHCTIANVAACIAAAAPDLQRPPFKLDIAYPLDNVFYTASFRGLNRMTISDYTPFLYTDSNVRTYSGDYRWNADMVTNEPSLPLGDYSKAKNFFAVRPHSAFDRWGRPVSAETLNRYSYQADGFMDTDQERNAFYDAMVKAGAKLPVSRQEFCQVWRDWNRKLEIDTRTGTFRGDTDSWGAFIGDLGHAAAKSNSWYKLQGEGDGWSFFGKTPQYDLFLAVMDGRADLKDASRLQYAMLGSGDFTLAAGGKEICAVSAGTLVNVGFKALEGTLATASKVFVTFYRSKSCQLPAKVRFGRRVSAVYACNRDGARLAQVPVEEGNAFRNLWQQGHMISHYEVCLE